MLELNWIIFSSSYSVCRKSHECRSYKCNVIFAWMLLNICRQFQSLVALPQYFLSYYIWIWRLLTFWWCCGMKKTKEMNSAELNLLCSFVRLEIEINWTVCSFYNATELKSQLSSLVLLVWVQKNWLSWIIPVAICVHSISCWCRYSEAWSRAADSRPRELQQLWYQRRWPSGPGGAEGVATAWQTINCWWGGRPFDQWNRHEQWPRVDVRWGVRSTWPVGRQCSHRLWRRTETSWPGWIMSSPEIKSSLKMWNPVGFVEFFVGG